MSPQNTRGNLPDERLRAMLETILVPLNRLVRAFLVLLVFILPYVAQAQTWNTESFLIQAPATFAGRTLTATDSSGNVVGSSTFGLVELWDSNWQTCSTHAVLSSPIGLYLDDNSSQSWTFTLDGWATSVGYQTVLDAWNAGNTTLILQTAFQTTATPPVQEFFIPEGRAGDAFGLAQPGSGGGPAVVTPVSVGNAAAGYLQEGSSQPGSYYSYVFASATFDPTKDFWLVDFTTHERGPTNETHLGTAIWTQDNTTYGLVAVTFYFEMVNWGYSFTLHYRIPDQPEMVQSLTAWPSGLTGWQTMGTWGSVDVTNLVSINGSVPLGSEYWVTRDVDGWDMRGLPSDPGYFLDPSITRPDPLQWRMSPPTPPDVATLEAKEFYVPTGMEGGYIHQLVADRALGDVVRTETWVDYDAQANAHNFVYDVRVAYINPNTPFWLDINGTEVTQGERWYFNGWSPLNGPSTPPSPQTTISGTLILPASRQFNYLQLIPPSGGGQTLDPWQWWGTNQSITLNDPWHGNWGMDLYTIQRQFEITFEGDLVNYAGGLTLFDETTGESRGISRDGNDFSQWWLPAASEPFYISLSRWGHDLRVRQPNGDDYRITRGNSQGDLSVLDGDAWYQPYYYFDGTGNRRPGLQFWVYDVSTGEESEWNQENLIDWIALRPPAGLQAALSGETAVALTWQIQGLGSINWIADGGFYVERQQNDGDWVRIATIAAVEEVNGNYTYADSGLSRGSQYRYRVAYFYGPPARRSNWVYSEIIKVIDPDSDDDGDGLTYAEEMALGTNPNVADGDNDGSPDGTEVANGTDPKNPDSDGDGAKDGADPYPNDSRRKGDIGIQHYARFDLSDALAGESYIGKNRKIEHVAISEDATQAAFCFYEGTKCHSVVVRLSDLQVLKHGEIECQDWFYDVGYTEYRARMVMGISSNGAIAIDTNAAIYDAGEVHDVKINHFVWMPDEGDPGWPSAPISDALDSQTVGFTGEVAYGWSKSGSTAPNAQVAESFVNQTYFPRGQWTTNPQGGFVYNPEEPAFWGTAGGGKYAAGIREDIDGQWVRGNERLAYWYNGVVTDISGLSPALSFYGAINGPNQQNGVFFMAGFVPDFIEPSGLEPELEKYPDPKPLGTPDIQTQFYYSSSTEPHIQDFHRCLPKEFWQQIIPTNVGSVNARGDVIFEAKVLSGPGKGNWWDGIFILERENGKLSEISASGAFEPSEMWFSPKIAPDGRGFSSNGILAAVDFPAYAQDGTPLPYMESGVPLQINGQTVAATQHAVLLLPVEVNCPELYMFRGNAKDVVMLCKASGFLCEWKLKNASPTIGTFDHPTDAACSFTATTPGKNTIQLIVGGKVAWEKPAEILDIISRATWGAHAADTSKMTTTPTINGLTYHHSADASDGAAEVLNIQEYHMSLGWYGLVGNGWGDIGYHFVMDKAGNIYQGREPESTPGATGGPYTLGSHVEGQNTAAGIGICILGKYEATMLGINGAEAFPAARQLALEKALSAISRRYKLNATQLSYHKARAVSNPTVCPGSNVIGKATGIKDHVQINLQ